MRRILNTMFVLPARHHLFGSLAMVIVVGVVLAARIADRRNFADGELHRDVMERWGAPIDQPSPSVRFVQSGTVFSGLEPLPLTRQQVRVDSVMNYRKRGLIYFSGFDFSFQGDYGVANPQARDIDIVFVFPINLEKNKVLLSDLAFSVRGAPARAELGAGGDKLVWTGRVKAGEQIDFRVAFRGRGLDSFTYRLDPAAAVANFRLLFRIRGGSNFDYQDGVVSAGATRVRGSETELEWHYPSLQSGIPVGVVLPSEKSYDRIIATLAIRGGAPFLLFFAGAIALALRQGRRLRAHEAALLAASYSLTFVLTAYLAAFIHFYAAWAIALALAAVLLVGYLRLLLSPAAALPALALWAAFLVVPSAAVVLQGYTGLIYTLEATSLVAGLMLLTTRPGGRDVLAALAQPATVAGGSHA